MSAQEFSTGRYHDGECWASCLYRLGSSRLHITTIGSCGLVHRSEPKEESGHIEPIMFHGDPYPVKRMLARFKAIARSAGATESAKAELARASASP